MGLLSRIKEAIFPQNDRSFRAEASIDLDVLYNHDEASRLLVGVDMPRLERINRDRGTKAHYGVGDLKVLDGSLEWLPHRSERSCGIRDLVFSADELRTVDIKPSAVVAILRDGTNIVFVVNKRVAKAGRPTPSVRPRSQEPPAIP